MTPFTRQIIPWVIAFAMLMDTLDSTILNTALPQIAYSFGEDPVHLKLALTSYLLSLGVFIPISGWMADHFGSKRVFIWAIVLFMLSSMGCGFAQNIYELVTMRIIQGMGGAMMMPVGRIILLRLYEKNELVKVTSRMMFALVGPTFGPAIGGFLTEYLSWRWIFYVNIPIGLIGIFLISKFLPYDAPMHKRKLDYIGFIIFGAGSALLLFALQELPVDDLSWARKLLLILLAVVFIGGYFFYSRTREHPVVDLTIFDNVVFKIASIGGFVSRLGIGSMPFLIPLMLQLSLGFSPATAGLYMISIALGQMGAKAIIKALLDKFGFKNLLIANTLILSVVIGLFSFIEQTTPGLLLCSLLFTYGVLTSTQFTCMNLLIFADIPTHQVSGGTSIAGTMQQLSASFGIAIFAMVLEYYLHSHDLGHVAPISAFHHTYWWIAAIIFVSCLQFSKLQANVGQDMSAKRNQ